MIHHERGDLDGHSEQSGREPAARAKAGLWRRFVNIYRSIRIPWLLYAASVGLGIMAAQITLWLVPPVAQITRGDFASSALVPLFVGLTLASIVVTLGRGLTEMYARHLVMARLQSVVWGRLLRAPMAALDRDHTPELVSRVTNDPRLAGDGLYAVTAFWTSLYGFVGAVIGMGKANGTLSLIFLAIVPITVLTFWLSGVTEFVAKRRIMVALGAMTGFFGERLGMLGQLKAFGSSDTEIRAGNAAIDKMFRAGLLQEVLEAVRTLLGSVVTTAAMLVVFVGGATYVRRGEMEQQDLSLYFALVGAAMPFLFEMLGRYLLLKGAQGYTEKIGHVLELPQEDGADGVPMPATPGDIRLEQVCFRYGPHEGLHQITATIPGGKVTAIVGPNGSGKSTLLKLLQRIYQPHHGSIRIGDVPIEDIALDDWRRAIGTVSQSPSLLSGTVRENIAFSDLDAAFHRVEHAARVADVHEFVGDHALGYDLEVGEGGEKLSGGQRQRVAIARALVPDTAILLLDEASNALDRRTDARVGAALTASMAGRTVVIVSHRLSTIAAADQVIVLRDGEVEAIGRHAELLETCTTYRRLAEAEDARFPS